MTLRRSSTARQDSDVPTTRAGDQTTAEVIGDPPAGHCTNPPEPHPTRGGAGRTRQRRTRRPVAGGAPKRPDTPAPQRPDMAAPERPDMTQHTGPADSLTPVQKIMHARLAVMSQPRHDDNPRRARLREVLRDRRLMAHVVANVDQWPPLSDEQRAEIAALLHHHRLDQ